MGSVLVALLASGFVSAPSARLLTADDTTVAPTSTPAQRLEQLEAKPMPSVAGPIVLMSIGVPLSLIAGYLDVLYLALVIPSGSVLDAFSVLLIIGLNVATVAGLVMTIAGIVLLTKTIAARKERVKQLDELRRELPPTPLAPPLPAPGVFLPEVAPNLLLAEF